MTTPAEVYEEERRREEEDAAWAAVSPPVPSRRRESPPEKLARGQREEAEGTCPPGARPKFVKITSGVHVQTRGPVLLARFVPEGTTRSSEPWRIYRLPGEKRLAWDEGRAAILDWIDRSEQIGGPTVRISNVKVEARKLIRAAGGELGS